MAVMPVEVTTEERVNTRISFAGSLQYREPESGDHGTAQWNGMSAGGASISLGRYLAPGRRIEMDYQGTVFSGRVVWSRPDRTGAFQTGLQFSAQTPEPLLLTLAAIRRDLVEPNISN